MKVKYAVISETGRRSRNEDYVKIINKLDESRWLGSLADGLGGHSNGSDASETVCNAVCEYWERPNNESPLIKARRACRSAAAKLDHLAYNMNHAQMGTTLVMASIDFDTITITHCGDSRCYLFRDGAVIYQTKDHVSNKWGWDSVSKCFFSYKSENAIPDIAQFEIKSGDRILLCSDGLYKSMPPEILEAKMMDDQSPEEILADLASLCEKYGNDNYSGIVAIIE